MAERWAWTTVALLCVVALCHVRMAPVSAIEFPCTGDNVRYVRRCGIANASQCSDANDGRGPHTAWATLQRAANHFNSSEASSGEVVIVGPGVYREGDIDLRRSGSRPFPKTFVADPAGTCTGDAPGLVQLDPQLQRDTGFLVFGASYVSVVGFDITNARVAGIQVKRGPFNEQPVGVVIANNVIHQNGLSEISRGIDVTNAEDTTIFNNLVYRNTGNGIGVLSAPYSKIINNTVYGHARYGVVIAQIPAVSPGPTPTPTPGPSTGSWLLNNIIADNATGGAVAFNVDVDRASGCDYIGAFNLIAGNPERAYSSETPRDLSDIQMAPRFVDNANNDFRLRSDSPAIDAGSELSRRLDLNNGSVLEDGSRDTGTVDLGYHFESDTVPTFDEVPATTQELYVSPDGDDGRDGASPETSVRTIAAAIDRARAVSRIIVAPGTYEETVAISAARPAGPIELFADPRGQETGAAPGRIVVDAHRGAAGINVIEHCSTVVDGFVVMNASDDGIRLKSAHRSIVRNNATHTNRARGINVVDTDDATIVNNLSYANVGGIQVGGNSVGSQRAIIENNTIYGNEADGVLIGTGPVASTGARLRYNIIDDNGQNGVQLDDNNRGGRSAAGFCAELNIVYHPDFTKRYGPILPQNCGLCSEAVAPCTAPVCRPTQGGQCVLNPPSDLTRDPSFVQPVAGRDGCIGGRRFWDDSFWLASGSPGIDFVPRPVTSESVGLNERTTERCDLRDRNQLDAGYHAAEQCFTDLPPLAGDCNGDFCVTVDELVTGVNIVLDRRPLSSCPAFDLNDSGTVTVNELVSSVNDLFCCQMVPATSP